jgi:LacI family transcriptional regulator
MISPFVAGHPGATRYNMTVVGNGALGNGGFVKSGSMKARVTIKDVAEKAGVSITTVSMILTKRPGWIGQFHPETIDRVRKAAETLGYRRNLFAVGSIARKPSFFALVLQQMSDRPTEAWHHWAFEGMLLEGVNAEAAKNRIHPILAVTRRDPDEAECDQVIAVIDGGVLGSIVRTPHDILERKLRERLGHGQPAIVVFPRRTSLWPTNAIDVDNVMIGQTAGKLLASRKRRHWVLVCYQQKTDAHGLRIKGFTRFARRSGSDLTMVHLPLGVDEHEAAKEIARRIDPVRVDAIFGIDSVASVGSLLACGNVGLAPGTACDIVGCDASSWRRPGSPAITCVDISWRRVGSLAVEKLLQVSRGGRGQFKTVLLKPGIVAGESCPVPAKFRPEGREEGMPVLPPRKKRSRRSGESPLAPTGTTAP